MVKITSICAGFYIGTNIYIELTSLSGQTTACSITFSHNNLKTHHLSQNYNLIFQNVKGHWQSAKTLLNIIKTKICRNQITSLI